MARVANKKTVDNNAGLLNTIVGIDRKKFLNVVDFGRFIVVILKDEAIFHTHIGFEVRIKRWSGVDMSGNALTTTTYSWLENLVDMHKEANEHKDELFTGTDVTYQAMLDSMVIITEANLTHPVTAFLNADDAAKFASERLDYLKNMMENLDEAINKKVEDETEEDLKKNFENGQAAINAEELEGQLNQEGKE